MALRTVSQVRKKRSPVWLLEPVSPFSLRMS